MHFIDLRSDTVTKPSDRMRKLMGKANVGDDVYEDDPTVNRLQEIAAEKLKKDAALFVPSGTMGNLIALLTYGGRGDEMILGHLSHIFQYEGGGAAGLVGMHPHILKNNPDGTIPIEEIEGAIREDDIHEPRSKLICLENTHNRCGGMALTPDYCDDIGDLAHNHGLSVHLDGARLFNAAVALNVEPSSLTRSADSVMFCLSKGLGAPVGSVLCGSSEFISKARRMRKLVGGGMRQAGVIAAAGIYALENNISRLKKDHKNAQLLAEGINNIQGLTVGAEGESQSPMTNLVYFSIDNIIAGNSALTADVLSECLKNHGILAHREGSVNQMRMVTHLNITHSDIMKTLSVLETVLEDETTYQRN